MAEVSLTTPPISNEEASLLLQTINRLEAEKKEYIDELVRANSLNTEFKETIQQMDVQNSISHTQSILLSEQYKVHERDLENQTKTNYQLRLMLQENTETIKEMCQKNKVLKELNKKYENELETLHEALIKLEREKQDERRRYQQKVEENEQLIRDIQTIQYTFSQGTGAKTSPVPEDEEHLQSSLYAGMGGVKTLRLQLDHSMSMQDSPLLPERSQFQSEREETLASALGNPVFASYRNIYSPQIESLLSSLAPVSERIKFAASPESAPAHSANSSAYNLMDQQLQQVQFLKEDNEALNGNVKRLNERNVGLKKELKEQEVKISGLVQQFQNEKNRLLKLQNDEYIEMQLKLNEKVKQIERMNTEHRELRATINDLNVPSSSYLSCYSFPGWLTPWD